MQPLLSDELPRRRGSRLAFFGGSFDPPHLGHLAIARAARDAFHLDTVLFAPVGMQPLKPEGSAAGFEDRVAMTRLAIEGEPGFAISLADAPKPSESHKAVPNYTIDALEKLRTSLTPNSVLYCLVGADSFFGMSRWHRAAEIPFMATLIVARRPGQSLESLREALPQGLALEPTPDGDKIESGVEVRAFLLVSSSGDHAPFYVLPGLDVEISASEIRAGLHQTSGALLPSPGDKPLLPPRVAGYIRSHGLYS